MGIWRNKSRLQWLRSLIFSLSAVFLFASVFGMIHKIYSTHSILYTYNIYRYMLAIAIMLIK